MADRAITFGGEAIFGRGEHRLEAGAWRRAQAEYGFAGLDGLASVDLGRRGRVLKQSGCLSAASVGALTALAERIAAWADGQAYTLVDERGVSYDNVRMDSFRLVGPMRSGAQACCDYEAVYTQLSERT